MKWKTVKNVLTKDSNSIDYKGESQDIQFHL